MTEATSEALLDNDAGLVSEGLIEDPNLAQGDDAGDQFDTGTYVGTYKDRANAEKGIKEKDTTINKLKSELAKREQRLKELEMEKSITNSLSETIAKAMPSSPKEDPQAKVQAMIERWENEGAKAMLPELISLLQDVKQESIRTASDQFKAELERVRNEELQPLTKRVREIDPEYLELKDKVAELESEFPDISRDKLVKLARKMTPKVSQPARPSLPVNVGSGAMAGGKRVKALTAELKDMLKGNLKATGLYTDKDIEDYLKKAEADNE